VLRYFFCANSLAAGSASEKSKIVPGATSPFIHIEALDDAQAGEDAPRCLVELLGADA
jgi:hypothetical protein